MPLDHLFIGVEAPGTAAQLFADLGFDEANGRCHPGQGTANRRFLFKNSFLEFLYLDESGESLNQQTRATMLYQRLSGASQFSPFGVCFRGSKDLSLAPFSEKWSYRPQYLPAGISLEIAKAPATEPLWFFKRESSQVKTAEKQLFKHSNGCENITEVAIEIAAPLWSNSTQEVSQASQIKLAKGPAHFMRLTFDGGRQKQCKNLSPGLPLQVCW